MRDRQIGSDSTISRISAKMAWTNWRALSDASRTKRWGRKEGKSLVVINQSYTLTSSHTHITLAKSCLDGDIQSHNSFKSRFHSTASQAVCSNKSTLILNIYLHPSHATFRIKRLPSISLLFRSSGRCRRRGKVRMRKKVRWKSCARRLG